MDVKATVEFADKNKLVRLKFPIPEEFIGGKTVGDGPYVWEEKPNTEITFQKWVGVKRGGEVYGVINDGVYAGKVENGYIHLTLLRGAGYCFHPIPNRELYPQDRCLPSIDSGRYVYNIRLFKGTMYEVNAQAERFNQLPNAINVFPTGQEKQAIQAIKIEGNVILGAFKSTSQDGYVLRIYNPSEMTETFTVHVYGNVFSAEIKAREVVSLAYEKGEFHFYQSKMLA